MASEPYTRMGASRLATNPNSCRTFGTRLAPFGKITVSSIPYRAGKSQKKLLENLKPLFQELEEVTGAIVKDFDGVQDIFTTLVAEKTFNLTLPDWTKALFLYKMEYPSGFSYVLPSYTDKLRRLKGGPLLKKILQDFKDKKEGKKGPRTKLYGGHDFTIANLLGALKGLEPHVPDYGVAIFLELYKNTQTNEYLVEIFYRNSTTEAPKQLTIPEHLDLVQKIENKLL